VKARLATSSAVGVVLIAAAVIGFRWVHNAPSDTAPHAAEAPAADPAKIVFDYDTLLDSAYTESRSVS